MRRWEELIGSEYDYAFEVQPEDGGNPGIRLAGGRVVGGSSALNTSFAFHAPDRDLAHWVELGAVGWGSEEMNGPRDRVGELVGVETAVPPHPASLAFLAAARETGFPHADYSGCDLPEGSGWMPLSSRGPLRQTSAQIYSALLDGKNESEFTLLHSTSVNRVL